MRIIDKNVDFYDYLQYVYPDDTLTFDRRDSYFLDRETFSYYLHAYSRNPYKKPETVLLQICNTFWLFSVTLIPPKYNRWSSSDRATDCEIQLVETWRNPSKERKLLALSQIELDWFLQQGNYRMAIDNSQYKTRHTFNKFEVRQDYKSGYKAHKKHIPILRDLGIEKIVDPMEVYLAIEEYFMKEREAMERTESVGLTNEEKITNHGFDTKTSFRGKIDKQL